MVCVHVPVHLPLLVGEEAAKRAGNELRRFIGARAMRRAEGKDLCAHAASVRRIPREPYDIRHFRR